jgi:SM-20-related protein
MMLRTDLLTRLGVFTMPAFLDQPTCARVRSEMLESAGARATVTMHLERDELAERYRRTTLAQVSDATASLIERKLLEIRTSLAETFSRSLDGCERPQFLVYKEGDYIRPHSDGSADEQAPEWLRKRSVATVVFLNDQSEHDEPDTFGGGALNFYGLLSDDPRGRSVALPVTPKAGLLVAFTAETVHGVSEVTRGERCTVVSWFSSSAGG